MEKILKALDAQYYDAAASLAQIQIQQAKSEYEKAQFRSMKAYALCQQGMFGYARQLVDPQTFTLFASANEVGKRTISMLNYTYAMGCDKIMYFLNFDLAKIEPLEKMYAQLQSKTTSTTYAVREELALGLTAVFMKLCKHKVEGIDALLDKIRKFFALLLDYNAAEQELKNENYPNILGNRLHRYHGFGLAHAVFYFLAGIMCNSVADCSSLYIALRYWLDNEVLNDVLKQLNPRLHLLLRSYTNSWDTGKTAVFYVLCDNFGKTHSKDYVSSIIHFSSTHYLPQFILEDYTFEARLIVAVCKLRNGESTECDLLKHCQSIEQFYQTYDVYKRFHPKMRLIDGCSRLVFAPSTETEVLDELYLVGDKTTLMDALFLSGAIIYQQFEVEYLKNSIVSLSRLIKLLEADYPQNAFHLKILEAKVQGINSSHLLTYFTQKTQTAHNLYLTSVPAIFPQFFAEQFYKTKLTAKDVFKSIRMLNHTDENTSWEFPYLMIGAVLYTSQQRFNVCENVEDALLNAGNPYVAGRFLETKHFINLSYYRMLADALVSAYNVLFASPQQLKDKPNLLFEGLCGNEVTTSPAAPYFIFCENYDVVCCKSLYFAEVPFYCQTVESFPYIYKGETKSQPRTLLKYDIFKYDSDFGESFAKLLLPEQDFRTCTRFGLLAAFCAAVMRLTFTVFTSRSEMLEDYVKQFLGREIEYFDAECISVFVDKLLLHKMLEKQPVSYDQLEYRVKTRNCDVYISAAIAGAIIRVAELKKFDVKQEKDVFKKMFGGVIYL